MRVVAYDAVLQEDVPPGCALADLDEIFQQADVLSLHCPLTADNARLVNAGRLGMMKPTAFLINTSRGPLIDEQALADALQAGRIAGAGLDVTVRNVSAFLHGRPRNVVNGLKTEGLCAWAPNESQRPIEGLH